MPALVIISYRKLVSLAVDCTVFKSSSLAESLADWVLRTDPDFRVQQYFIINTHELFSCFLDSDLGWFYRTSKPQESAVYFSNRKQSRETFIRKRHFLYFRDQAAYLFSTNSWIKTQAKVHKQNRVSMTTKTCSPPTNVLKRLLVNGKSTLTGKYSKLWLQSVITRA